jgi:hypothetical protein
MQWLSLKLSYYRTLRYCAVEDHLFIKRMLTESLDIRGAWHPLHFPMLTSFLYRTFGALDSFKDADHCSERPLSQSPCADTNSAATYFRDHVHTSNTVTPKA